MLKIGWASRDVSTDKPVIIRGQHYTRISKGVLDPIMATALTVENNGDYVIFLSTDTTDTVAGVLNLVCEKVKNKNKEIDTAKILMSATHAHTSPIQFDCRHWGSINDIPHDGVTIADSYEYTEFFASMCAEAVCESFEKRKNGLIAYGYGYAAVAHHRRVVYDPELSESEERKAELKQIGTTKMYGHTKLPDFSGYESGPDHFANFMFTFDQNEKMTGAIINIPCPSQNCEVENYLSADYWHDVRTILKKRYGEDLYILPQCAAAGDMSPRILHYHKAQERRYALKFSGIPEDSRLIAPYEMQNRRDIAIRICDSFDEVYSWAGKEKYSDAKVVHKTKTLDLAKIYVSKEDYEKYKARLIEDQKNLVYDKTVSPEEALKKYTSRLCKVREDKYVINRYETQNEDKAHKTEIHIIRIGDIAFASNQFELFMDYQHRIQARSPFIQTFIVQLAAQYHCDSGTYLPTKRAVKGKGYSAVMESSIVSPEGGNQLVEDTLVELNGISE